MFSPNSTVLCNQEKGHHQTGVFHNGNEDPGTNQPLWACPFYKFDSIGYEDCRAYQIKRYSDIKQHILRCHSCPEVDCSNYRRRQRNGSTDLTDLGMCDRCQAEPKPEWLDHTELGELDRIPRRWNDRTKYNRLWKILFKDQSEPATPFLEVELAQPARIVRSLRERILYDQFPQALERRGITAPPGAIPFLITDITTIMFDSFTVPQPRSRRLRDNLIAAQVAHIKHSFGLQWIPGQTTSINSETASTAHHTQSYETGCGQELDGTPAIALDENSRMGTDTDHVFEDNLDDRLAGSTSNTADLAIALPITHDNFAPGRSARTQQAAELEWDGFIDRLDEDNMFKLDGTVGHFMSQTDNW